MARGQDNTAGGGGLAIMTSSSIILIVISCLTSTLIIALGFDTDKTMSQSNLWTLFGSRFILSPAPAAHHPEGKIEDILQILSDICSCLSRSTYVIKILNNV